MNTIRTIGVIVFLLGLISLSVDIVLSFVVSDITFSWLLFLGLGSITIGGVNVFISVSRILNKRK